MSENDPSVCLSGLSKECPHHPTAPVKSAKDAMDKLNLSDRLPMPERTFPMPENIKKALYDSFPSKITDSLDRGVGGISAAPREKVTCLLDAKPTTPEHREDSEKKESCDEDGDENLKEPKVMEDVYGNCVVNCGTEDMGMNIHASKNQHSINGVWSFDRETSLALRAAINPKMNIGKLYWLNKYKAVIPEI